MERRFVSRKMRSAALAAGLTLLICVCGTTAVQAGPVLPGHGIPELTQPKPVHQVADKMPILSLKDVTTPAAGSAERKTIMDVLRKTVPDEFQPVKFKVNNLKVGGGYATADVQPIKANGQPVGCSEGDDMSSEFWLKKVKGQWTIIVSNICGGDPAFFEAKEKGAPPQLLGKNSWDEILAE